MSVVICTTFVQVIQLELAVLQILAAEVEERLPPARLHVLLEHFSLEHQPALDSFQRGELTESELVDR